MPANSGAPTIRVIFARRLKELRVPRGFPTARSFATALDIDENRYTRYERAEVEPDLSLIMRICSALQVTPNDLLDLTPAAIAPGGFADGIGPLPVAADAAADRSAVRRAHTWQLAEELGRLEGGGAANAFDKLSRTSRIFAEIDANPFGFVAQMAADQRYAVLDHAISARLGAIAEQLIEAVNADILGQRATT